MGESDGSTWRGSARTPHLGDGTAVPTTAGPSGMWRAYYHFVRPHASLRVALVQPRERGGKLLPQHYRQRTPAMAAGITHRRWTAREVLSCPLPKLSA